MSNAVPAEISVQLSLALNAIERHLESTLLACICTALHWTVA
jgi:hypothetical protein